MPYDLSPLSDYLSRVSPSSVVLQLDYSLYDMVMNADFYHDPEGLGARYHDLLVLRNHFADIAALPHIEPDGKWK